MENYGATIKQIRIGKGMTQKEVSTSIISQGNYSKFESGENPDIKVSILQALLLRLNLPIAEFFYIHNGYSHPEKVAIQRMLYESFYNDPDLMQSILKRAQTYILQYPNDQDMLLFIDMIHGLMVLAQTKDIDKTRQLVEPIWEKLSKRNELLISDIYMLNNILYIFPLETAMEILQFLFRQIERYGRFRFVNRMKYNLTLNASLLQMKSQHFDEALALIEAALPDLQKEKLFLQLAVCYIRKGICLHKLQQDGSVWLEKGERILTVLEQEKLLQTLQDEIKNYKN